MAIGVSDPVKAKPVLSAPVQEKKDSNTNCLIAVLALGIILIVATMITAHCCPSLSFNAEEALAGCLFGGVSFVGISLIGLCFQCCCMGRPLPRAGG